MKIFLSPSNQDENKYAWGDTNEAAQCLKIAESCKAFLEARGFEVKLMHGENMQTKVAAADIWGADFYIPIHTNAFNGRVSGTRMFYYTEGGKGQALGEAIFRRLAPLTPGDSESLRQHTGLYELKAPNAFACYIEADFHDVPDTAKWIVEHTREIGEAIAMGICDYAGVSVEKSTLYRVQVGAFRVRENAEKLLQKLKDAGFPGFVTEVSA